MVSGIGESNLSVYKVFLRPGTPGSVKVNDVVSIKTKFNEPLMFRKEVGVEGRWVLQRDLNIIRRRRKVCQTQFIL